MTDSIDLNPHRNNLPSLQDKLYFNYGGQGILPQTSLETIVKSYQYYEEIGVFSLKANQYIDQQTFHLKQSLATLLNTTPNTLTLTENVTMGCNIALWGLHWKAGDHILLSDAEHLGIVAIVHELAQRFDLTYSFFPVNDYPMATIQTHLQPNTRLLIISHVLWNTGQVMPLQDISKICHTHQTQVLVDAAQSVGVLPLNLPELDVDFYAFTGHKWLCGPAGVGGLYVSPTARTTLAPTFIGWRSGRFKPQQGDWEVEWSKDGSLYEVATSAYPLYEGLVCSIDYHNQWKSTVDRYLRICQLSEFLWKGLQSIPTVHPVLTYPPQSGLVSFTLERTPLNHSTMVQRLETQQIFLRTLASPSCIRACLHYFTTEEEVDRLLTAIKALI